MCLLLTIALLFAWSNTGFAQPGGLRTRVVRASYRIEHPRTSGTGFVVARPHPVDHGQEQWLLITAAHAFTKMEGERPTLVLRRQTVDGDWQADPRPIEIRRGGTPLWQKHPQHDVAVLALEGLEDVEVDTIPLDALADAAAWRARPAQPGDLIRCVGFPHAAQFKPSAAAFPSTRLGCIASYPLTPFERHPTFLADYNSFEGDSGALVYTEDSAGLVQVIGLVTGQHFVDERYQLIYQQGLMRERLGLAIVVNSQAIFETIQALPDGSSSP